MRCRPVRRHDDAARAHPGDGCDREPARRGAARSRSPPAVCWDSRSGTGENRQDYSTAPARQPTAKNVRKPSQFCELQRLRTPAWGRCRRAPGARRGSAAARRRRTARSALRERLAPLREHRPHHRSNSGLVRRAATAGRPERRAARPPSGPWAPAGTRPAAASAAAGRRRAAARGWPARRSRCVPGRRLEPSATSRCSISVASTSRPLLAMRAEQPEQDRRGDVVGQVAGDPERRLARQRRQIELEEVARAPASTFGGSRGASAATMSRSISTAVRCATRGASRSVSAPGPGPISRNRSVGRGSIAATSLSAHAGSRKCWPNRFCARTVVTRPHHTSSSDSPRQYFSSISSISSSLIPK